MYIFLEITECSVHALSFQLWFCENNDEANYTVVLATRGQFVYKKKICRRKDLSVFNCSFP